MRAAGTAQGRRDDVPRRFGTFTGSSRGGLGELSTGTVISLPPSPAALRRSSSVATSAAQLVSRLSIRMFEKTAHHGNGCAARATFAMSRDASGPRLEIGDIALIISFAGRRTTSCTDNEVRPARLPERHGSL